MIFLKDAKGLSFALFNRAGEELLGIERNELIGKNDFHFFPESDAVFFQQKDRETLARKVLVDIPEEPLQTARGVRWLHTKKVPILGEDGTPTYLLGISEDITERKAQEAELRTARVQTEAANEELEAFAYSVAHDLRAPLRRIDGFSQILLEDHSEKLDEEGKKYLALVRKSAQHMGDLIDDLLTLSRVTRSEIRTEPVDLGALALERLDRLRRATPEREVEVVIGEHLVVDADPRLVGIALDNLIENAWKFTGKKAHARIEVGAEVDAATGRRVFYVRDDGVGFDMAHVDKLFGPFQRLHTTSEFEGTGIGLATVRRIARRHGGDAWADADVDRGATIRFTLEP
jgi:PAS domain S-box-containing protein